MTSNSYMVREYLITCGIRLDTQSSGWYKTMTKVMKDIQGATYSIDAEEGMAYVSGKVDPQKLLKRLVKAGKEAELCWVTTGPDQYTNYGNVGYHQHPYSSGGGSGYYEDPRHAPYRDPYYNWDAYNQHAYYNSYEPSSFHYNPNASYPYHHRYY
ncbi:hypothetical protein FNV43_RR03798 [Rhamnella rubrinervis]|uniref:HMA domain-containing protein n=1 Tax=Rhamnella rubrinervis TaxID=2594499 RepID=A0A8K0HKN7_9ROSA|nr:hypothetical protein FNV43_RR03798 [Rhamnella rubrinervis]